MHRDYLLTIVQLVGVVQCLFLAIALVYLPGHRIQASRWLSAFFLVWAILFVHMALRQNDLERLLPLLSFLRLPLFFLFGPLLYLYLKQATAPAQPLRWQDAARHLCVFAVVLCAYMPSLALERNSLVQTLYYRELRVLFPYAASITATQEWLLALTRFVMQVFVLHLLVYMLLCLRLLAQHKRRVREHFSQLDKVSLDWMRNLLFTLALLWISVAASQVLFASTGIGRLINDAQGPVLVLFLSALGLFGLLQKQVPLPPQSSGNAAPAEPVTRYRPGDEKLQSESARLEAFMRKEKPHLDSELTLSDLAERFGLPARQLSQVINGGLGQNFIDFVNGHRIEEAKALLADHGSSRSVLTIAMDAGFNSKSAFYSAFKRHTGQTPSQFRNDCLASMPAPEA